MRNSSRNLLWVLPNLWPWVFPGQQWGCFLVEYQLCHWRLLASVLATIGKPVRILHAPKWTQWPMYGLCLVYWLRLLPPLACARAAKDGRVRWKRFGFQGSCCHLRTQGCFLVPAPWQVYLHNDKVANKCRAITFFYSRKVSKITKTVEFNYYCLSLSGLMISWLTDDKSG